MSTSNTRFGQSKTEKAAESLGERVKTGAEAVEHDAAQMADSLKRNASDLADTVSSKLKTVGVDTDVMANAAKDQASELQRLIGNELQANPMRALGIAAAVGIFVGLITAR
jgi:ElaB/YqjD/DUF883 family membrane-anchored ribosome-binding protein